MFIPAQDCSDAMDAKAVQEWADIIMHALRNPHSPRPSEEPIIGEIIRSSVFLVVCDMSINDRE